VKRRGLFRAVLGAGRNRLVRGARRRGSDYDEKLILRFDWLREPDPGAVATPSMFKVFDFLHQDGRKLTGRPLRDRRARLANAIDSSELVLPVRRLARERFRRVGRGGRA